jgi:hypothetical protein
VVGGNMLGDEYCDVLINGPTPTADEKLPRPYKDIETFKDALGHVIACPRFYVSIFSYVQALHSLVRSLLNYLFINFVHCRSKRRKTSSNPTNDNLVCYILLIFLNNGRLRIMQ